MGFFSSTKKDEPKENTVRPVLSVKSLRSRLQGYARKLDSGGKERESPAPVFSQPMSVAATLSGPGPLDYPVGTPIANRQLQLKLSSSSPALRNAAKPAKASGSASTSTNAASAATPQTKHHSMLPSSSSSPDSNTSSPGQNHASRSRALGTKTSSSSLAAPRKQSDHLTTTLAQRLNELAVANSEGLLNDDEYRLLRQDLFERFTSTNVVPTETPVVPIASQHRSVRIATATTGKRPSIDSARMSVTASSSFNAESYKSGHRGSRSSISGVASLFRRATSRQGSTRDDASSVFSGTSAAPSESAGTRIKRLARKTSDSSLTTDRGDTISISSRRTNNASIASPVEPTGGAPSVRSIRRLPMPPSSFPGRLPGVESRYAGMNDDDRDETKKEPESARTLRQEILAVEAEARRLMDAFNGLELSTLTKHRRTSMMGPRDSVATLIPDAAPSNNNLGDAASMRSVTSAGTSTSRRRPKPNGPVSMHGYSASSRSDSGYATSSSLRTGSTLDRKNSTSSMGSSRLGIGPTRSASESNTAYAHGATLTVPPVPPIPSTLGISLSAAGSTPSLSRSLNHPTMGVLHENEPMVTVDLDEEREFGQEMDDLRRRREEVAGRYEERLEYLRAKLRGVELHERLLSR
uniref:Uncharacterized protein n=1 Tax=Mycena chlorophos TaxID=658473 RepID=A0ABQ0MDX3_MYCCL|nr:predicted protein [Mycena chlorophos]